AARASRALFRRASFFVSSRRMGMARDSASAPIAGLGAGSQGSRNDDGKKSVKVICCHPSGLMYTEIFLRLEPLGLELVAGALRAAGHEVRLIDLQVFRAADLLRLVDQWMPDAVVFSANYLANIPEVIDLAKAV